MTTDSYVNSHTQAGKGTQYDAVYRQDHWHRYLWSREQQVLTRMLGELYGTTPIRALDFACGTGRITAALESQVHEITGVDVSEAMLEVAAAKVKRATLLHGNILQDALFAGRTFNLVTAFRFFVNAEQALREAAIKALAPLVSDDGYLVFNNHQNYDSAYIQLTKAYAQWKGFTFANTLSMRECEALVALVGFEIVRVYPVALVHFPRLNLPHAVYGMADAVAGASSALARHSESPIIVARRRRA